MYQVERAVKAFWDRCCFWCCFRCCWQRHYGGSVHHAARIHVGKDEDDQTDSEVSILDGDDDDRWGAVTFDDDDDDDGMSNDNDASDDGDETSSRHGPNALLPNRERVGATRSAAVLPANSMSTEGATARQRILPGERVPPQQVQPSAGRQGQQQLQQQLQQQQQPRQQQQQQVAQAPMQQSSHRQLLVQPHAGVGVGFDVHPASSGPQPVLHPRASPHASRARDAQVR